MSNQQFAPGDRVRMGRTAGTVLGVIERGDFRDPRDAIRWRGLVRGVIVHCDDGDVRHVRDAGHVLSRLCST